jgi:predicted transcriptional regulator
MATKTANDPLRIEDARDLRFCQVDNVLIRSSDLDPYAKLVYVALCGYANLYTVDCHPSIKTLCVNLGISKPTVLKAIKSLCDHGVLEVVERHDEAGRDQSHLYVIKDWRSTETGRVNDVDTRVKQIDTRVNDVDGEGKGRLPGRVNDVDTKDKERERERSKDNQVIHSLSQIIPPLCLDSSIEEKTIQKDKSKIPKVPSTLIQVVTFGIDEVYGEKYPQWPKHVAAIKQLLSLDYTTEEIIGCWKCIYDNYDGRFPPLAWVIDNIKSYRQNGGKLPQKGSNSGNNQKYPGPRRGEDNTAYYRRTDALAKKSLGRILPTT